MRGFLAGTGIFLLGIKMMEDALMHGSVATLKRILKSYTDKMRKAVLSGTLIATIAQSSTIVSVMTVAFVGAGVISLASGVGVMIGANIGSTVLGLVFGGALGASIKLSALALPMLAVGGVGELFFRKKKTIYIITRVIFSFGLIFYGISLINDVVSAYALNIDMSIITQWGLLGYFMVGVLLTALMHSSDAMLIIALAFLGQGVITFPEGIAIIIGANLGTTISAIEGAASGSSEQKQVALSHFLFNLISALIGLPLVYLSVTFLGNFFELPRQNVIALAVYDVIYNVFGAILFYPFLSQFVKLLKHLVRQKEPDFVLHSSHVMVMANLEKSILAFTEDVMMLMRKVYQFNAKALSIDVTVLEDPKSSLETKYGAKSYVEDENLEQEYKIIATIEESLIQFVVKIFERHKEAANEYRTTLYVLREAIERIVYSAKTLRDSKETLDELRDVQMPLIDEYINQFTKEMIDMYVIIGAYLNAKETKEHRNHIHKYFLYLTNADEHFLNLISDTLPQQVLSNRQVGYLVHLSQALNRSHKAMLHTVDLLFPEKVK